MLPDTAILEDLGFTNAEIKVYFTLMTLGSSTGGPIIDKSGLQHSVVYRALHSLMERGLINFIQQGRRKIYQATEPEHLLDYIDEKKEHLKRLLPVLKEQQLLAREHETATVYKGIRGVKEVYSIMINTKAKEYNTFGGGIQCARRMSATWWLNLHTRRVANKLPSRQVFDESVRALGKDIARKTITSIRYLKKEFAQFQETVIVGDKVAITVFTEHPYSFLIQDKEVADGYRKYFELLWKIAVP